MANSAAAKSQEHYNDMRRTFIEATAELLLDYGFENLTIRKIAKRAGFNSATFYKYFYDLDELITFASFKLRKNYIMELQESLDSCQNALERYRTVKDLYCRNAFSLPDIYMLLSFGKYAKIFEQIASSYYLLYPVETQILQSDVMVSIMNEGIYQSDLKLAQELAHEGFIREGYETFFSETTLNVQCSYLNMCIVNPVVDQNRLLEKYMDFFDKLVDLCK